MRWQSDNEDVRAYRAAKHRLAALRQRQEARDFKEHMAAYTMPDAERDVPTTWLPPAE